jgi:hypothetical protein
MGVRDRVLLVVMGLLGLVFWAGYIVFPVVLVLAALVPVFWGKKE